MNYGGVFDLRMKSITSIYLLVFYLIKKKKYFILYCSLIHKGRVMKGSIQSAYVKKGFIIVIVGPMYAAKTKEAIAIAEKFRISYNIRGISFDDKIIAFKPVVDTRGENSKIASRNGDDFLATMVEKNDFDAILRISEDKDIIIIDELQFFDKDIYKVLKQLRKQGKFVICSGLDMDFNQDPFETTAFVMAIANEVQKWVAVCHTCGDIGAQYSMLNVKKTCLEDSNIIIDEGNTYRAICGSCLQNI
jgi:thymidine kinase